MKYLKTPGEIMTSSMEDHKTRGTSGEDYVRTGGCASTTKMIKPCSDLKLIGSRNFSDGTYKEFYQGSMNGYKFSMYTCHCHDFVTTGDDYAGSTGYHLHQLYFHGHQTIDYMQDNRNTKGVKQSEIDAKCVPTSTTTPPTSTNTKEYVEAVRSGKTSDNGTFKFDVKYYDELKDLCNQKDIYDLSGVKWLSGTTWTSIKKVGSSSSRYKLTQYYYNGWKKDTSIPFYNDDKDLKKLGNGEYQLLKDKSGWLKGTKFKK